MIFTLFHSDSAPAWDPHHYPVGTYATRTQRRTEKPVSGPHVIAYGTYETRCTAPVGTFATGHHLVPQKP